jgi:hypothetical protein
MTDPHTPPNTVPTAPGAWSIWLAVSSLLIAVVLQLIWGWYILLPQWKLVGGEPDPNYISQQNIGTALFSGTGIVLALAAAITGTLSIGGARNFRRRQPGRLSAMVRGWTAIAIGSLVILYCIISLSVIF